jgi:Zn-dependent protease with chaperone function
VSAAPGEPSPPLSAPLGARLSPFVFPSDTTFRFLLLLVAVVGANLYIWNWLHTVYGIDQEAAINAYLVCTEERDALLGQATINDTASLEAASDTFTACVNQVNSSLPWWMIGGTVLLLGVAAAILFSLPAWIARRRHLRPLEAEEAPAVVEELGALAREAGLDEEPRWLWNPLDPSPTGLAFGRPGHHSVALNGGLVTRQFADPPAFRAVVRHELAHLRNRDVDLTYATVALWYAFLLVGVVPFLVTIADEGAEFVLSLLWRVLALALLVYLTRNAVLRAREVYADVRASVPDGPQGALRRILGGLPERSTSMWRRLWRVHPDPRQRLASVNDPRRLFPLGLLVTFGVGIASTIAYTSVSLLISQFVSDPITIHLLAAGVFAPLAMAAIGVGVWRGTWSALAEGARPPSTWPYALALAAGLLIGPELALDRIARTDDNETLLGNSLGTGALWIAALVIGLVLILAWVGASAETWLKALAGTRRPALAAALGLVFASLMVAFFIGVFYSIYDTRPVLWISRSAAAGDHAQISDLVWVGPKWLYQFVNDAYTLIVLTHPIVFIALVAVWLYPFAAWLWRRTERGEASWAFLEPGGRLRIPLLERRSLDPWLVGALAGLVCLGALLVLRLGLRASVDAETRAEDLFLFGFFHLQIVLALVFQGAAAVIATMRGRARDLPLVAGMAAAFTTGVIATAGIVVGPTVAGCVDPIAMNPGPCAWDVDASFSWLILRMVVAEGAVVAIAGGLVVLGVQAVLHRRHAPVPAPTA